MLSSSSKGEAQVGFDVNGKYWIVAWVQVILQGKEEGVGVGSEGGEGG